MAAVIIFAAICAGAHDLWAATLVYLTVLFLFVAVVANSTRAASPSLKLPLIIPALVVMGAMALSFSRASNPSESFLGLMDWLCALVAFYVGINIFADQKPTDDLLRAMIVILWIEFAVDISQVFSIKDMGTMKNANVLMAFVLPWTVIYIVRIIREFRESRSCCTAWAFGAFAGLGCMILAQSVSGWLCFGAVLGFLFVPRRYWPGVLIATLVMFAIATVFKNESDRLYWWRSAIAMFVDYPWTGIGIGNFPSAYLAYRRGAMENTLFAHSAPLGWLAETGVIGVSALILFFASWVYRARAAYRLEKIRIEFVLAFFATLSFYSINIGVEYLVNLVSLMLLMAAAIAPADSGGMKPRPSIAFVTATLALAALPSIVSPFFASRFIVDGQRNLAEKNWPAAQTSFESAVALDSRVWEPYAGLARVAFERGDVAEALTYLQQAIRRNTLHYGLRMQLEEYQRRLR